MMATTWWQVAIWGMVGPFLVELAKLATWHSVRQTMSRWRMPYYWVWFAAFVTLGGILSVLILHTQPVQAVHLGATAPLIVAAWASADSDSGEKSRSTRRSGRAVQGIATSEDRPSRLEMFKQYVRW
jgi:hypothetical protein